MVSFVLSACPPAFGAAALTTDHCLPCCRRLLLLLLQVRWAVLNVVTLLRRHARVQDALAAAMRRGSSVGGCIEVIERELAGCTVV